MMLQNCYRVLYTDNLPSDNAVSRPLRVVACLIVTPSVRLRPVDNRKYESQHSLQQQQEMNLGRHTLSLQVTDLRYQAIVSSVY